MTEPRPPMWVARAGISLAVRPLPTWQDRLRYRDEFLAELHDLPPTAQLRFTAGVLSQTFALRAALGASPTRAEEAAMTLTTPAFYWRCRVLHFHHWVLRWTEDGHKYNACSRCGLDRGDATPPTGAFLG